MPRGFSAQLGASIMPRGLSLSRTRPRMHTEKSFRNLVKSNRNQIVFTIFRLIWNQMVPNQSENGKWNLISVWFNKITERFIYAYNDQERHVFLSNHGIPIKGPLIGGLEGPPYFNCHSLECYRSRLNILCVIFIIISILIILFIIVIIMIVWPL